MNALDIQKIAVAGSPESSDVQVTIEPGEGEIELEIASSVLNQYGHQIQKTVLETLTRLNVTSARVTLVDKGALDCTIRARVECAVQRACDLDTENPVDWGGLIRE